MIILAVYYTVADIVLLAQCFYYRGFTLSDAPSKVALQADEERVLEEDVTETSPLISRESAVDGTPQHLHSVDVTQISTATPLIPNSDPAMTFSSFRTHSSILGSIFYNTGALLIVCLTGIAFWYLYILQTHSHSHPSAATPTSPLHIDIWGQIFGYLCAVLYLGSRVPQLLLNHRRRSTKGVSPLSFLFACVGNLTYVLSIFVYEPSCARVAGGGNLDDRGFCERDEWGKTYARYILVNASWILGSAGTLGLDLMVFAQFCWYREKKA